MSRLVVVFFCLLASPAFAAQGSESAVYVVDENTNEAQIILVSDHSPFVKGGKCSKKAGCYLQYVNYNKNSNAWRCETQEGEACPWMY